MGGNVTAGASIYIALASRYDGIANGFSNPLPTLKIKDVLIDGMHGLDLGTGATNIPASALVNFPISSVIAGSIDDAKPDILVSQVAQPTSTGDTLYFINSSGVVVGNKVSINWTTISKLGTYYLDLYTLPSGALCDTARINGTFDKETTREIRLIAFRLSDFGITAGNGSTVAGFILKASGTSDPAFIAYNTDAFVIPAPVITVQPTSRIVCPNVSNSTTFTVTATGGSLQYQWRKNNINIPGATGTSYTIPAVVTASAGTYTVEVSNPVGSVVSEQAFLNVSIAVQPTPATQLIATGAACTLSISANHATSYQWIKNGIDISGETGASMVIQSVNSTDASDYTVRVINAANGGCANIVSTAVTVTGSNILYSKTGVDLNIPGSWGVASNGSGSSPIDFTRTAHTFIVQNNASTGGSLTVAGTVDLANAITTVPANATLDAGSIIRSGTGSLNVTVSATVTVRGNSNLYFHPGGRELKNLNVYSGNVHLLSPLSITAGSASGTITLMGGNLYTNDNLTLKSNATGTARLATISGGAVLTGQVTMERFIPAARGWRLLSVPIGSAGAPTINEAWQEGVTTASTVSNPYPGFGGQITGGTTANGFDQSSTNSPSIKIFDPAISSFVRLPAVPGTHIPISSYPAYFLYLRGDRGINLMQGLSAAITSTTLRIKGQVKTGNQVIPVNAANYTLVGNPFPSAIDFATITKTNVNNTLYVWDPKLAGNYGLGGYVTVSYNSQTGNYDKTASVSPVSQYVQSGEAFFVSTADNLNPGTLTIGETDKSAGGSDLVYRDPALEQKMRINLYMIHANDSASLLDGVLTTFADENSNLVNNQDAVKLNSSNENIGIKRQGKMLSIERRKTMLENDTTFLNIYQVRIQNYRLEIIADNLETGNTIAVIKDSYSNTSNNMPIDMNGTTYVPFSINADPASYAINRFSIVFLKQVVLPVSFKWVKATRQSKKIKVEWGTDNELNTAMYEVERSTDGVHFTEITSVPATATTGASAVYAAIDEKPVTGINIYRIRSIDHDGRFAFSTMVKVAMEADNHEPGIMVYPNPVKGNIIPLQMNQMPKGVYMIQLYNTGGQLITTSSIQFSGNNSVEMITLRDKPAPGKYELKVSGNQTQFFTSVILQ